MAHVFFHLIGLFVKFLFACAVGFFAYWAFSAVIPEAWATWAGVGLAAAEFAAAVFGAPGAGVKLAARLGAVPLAWPLTARALEFVPKFGDERFAGVHSGIGLAVAAGVALVLAGGHGSGRDNQRFGPLLAAAALPLLATAGAASAGAVGGIATGGMLATVLLVEGLPVAQEVRDRLLLAATAPAVVAAVLALVGLARARFL